VPASVVMIPAQHVVTVEAVPLVVITGTAALKAGWAGLAPSCWAAPPATRVATESARNNVCFVPFMACPSLSLPHRGPAC
jgi:hypothetical protein